MCLNVRSIINKTTELNIMVDDIKPHIIGITESWANNDITDAELGLEGYVMFRKDIMGRRGGGVLLEDQKLLCLVQDNFLTQHTCIRTNQSRKSIIYSAILAEGICRQSSNTRTIGQQRS